MDDTPSRPEAALAATLRADPAGNGAVDAADAADEPAGLDLPGRLLARNTGLNLAGLALPLLVAVVAMPPLVRGLGTERFGILAIAWMLIGYLGEVGVGRAGTKFVAEALGTGDSERVAEAAWTAMALQAVFGVLCGAVLAVATPALVGSVLEIPEAVAAEARAAFLILSAALPLAIGASAVRGVLEAAQRFDLVSAVRIPATVAGYALPLAALGLGWALPGILGLVVAARLCALLALAALAARAVPELRGWPAIGRAPLRRMAAYGGWISVSSVVSPLLVYLDRLMLGMLVTMSAVAYYAVPFEVVSRLVILPASIVATLFPAFSALGGRARWDRIRRLAVLALKAILLLVGPVAVALAAGAADILRLWLGADFARESTAALVILTAGVLVNALAHVPYALIQGLGRADITAKLHLLELPVQVILVWVLVRTWGIPGAALAWTVRVTLDAALLFVAAGRLAGLSPAILVEERVARAGALVLGAGVLGLAAAAWAPGPAARVGTLAAILAALAWTSWRIALPEADRTRLLGAARAATGR